MSQDSPDSGFTAAAQKRQRASDMASQEAISDDLHISDNPSLSLRPRDAVDMEMDSTAMAIADLQLQQWHCTGSPSPGDCAAAAAVQMRLCALVEGFSSVVGKRCRLRVCGAWQQSRIAAQAKNELSVSLRCGPPNRLPLLVCGSCRSLADREGARKKRLSTGCGTPREHRPQEWRNGQIGRLKRPQILLLRSLLPLHTAANEPATSDENCRKQNLQRRANRSMK